MEPFVEGVVSDKLGKVPVAIAIAALRQVVATLVALLKQGVSHGDLSPANVIFAVDESAHAAGERAENTGLGLRTVLIDCGIVGPGALAYAAPERFQGKHADEKSDLFSLGLLLFRWIAGEDLVHADGYEQFAELMANIDNVNVTEKLYATGDFSSPEGASSFLRWNRYGQDFSVLMSRNASKIWTNSMNFWKLLWTRLFMAKWLS